MAEAFPGVYPVSDELLELFYLWETAHLLAVKYHLFVDPDDIAAAGLAGLQKHAFYVIWEGGEQFLGHVGSPKHPAAFRTVFYADDWFHSQRQAGVKVEIESQRERKSPIGRKQNRHNQEKRKTTEDAEKMLSRLLYGWSSESDDIDG